MHLDNKPDLDKTLERFEAWWHCEIIDRPPVNIGTTDDRDVKWPVKQHATHRERWFDIDYILDGLDAAFTHRHFAGDTLPTFMPNIGPEVCATVYGAELDFSADSSWSRPIAASCGEVMKLKCNLDTPYWDFIGRLTRQSIERGRGKWITGITDLHSNGDLLAALRDPQELLLEMAEDVPAVRAAMRHITPDFKLMFDDLCDMIRPAGLPTLSWIPAPHQGRMNIAQCDLICMISSALFQDLILPALQWEMAQVDRTIFHLDGPGALRHLDALLDCKDLHAVQWVRGDGNGPAAKWIDVYQRIQAGGKAMQLLCEDLGDARILMENLKPQGCWFCVNGTYTIAEAEAFLKEVEQWSAQSCGRERSTR